MTLKIKMAGMAAMLCVLLTATRGRADLVVQIAPEHTTLHHLEACNLLVTVSNNGSATVVLDPQRGEGHGYLAFDVRRMDGNSPQTVPVAPLLVAATLETGDSQRFLLDLAHSCPMATVCGYNVEAYVNWNDMRYASRMVNLNVINGLPIKSETRESPLSASATRTYRLSYLSREGREILFLSVSEAPSSLNYGVFPLGPMVRVFDPVLEIDRKGVITVVHQTGPRQYARTLLQTSPGGVRLLDQNYKTLQGRMGAKGEWALPGAPPAPMRTIPESER